MITAKGILYFVIGFLLIGLLILISGFSAEATCTPPGYVSLGNGGAVPSGNAWIPGYAMPYNFTGNTNYYWSFSGSSSLGCISASGNYCNAWHDTGGGTVKEWRDCYTGSCTGGLVHCQTYDYGRYGTYTVSGNGSAHDFDCDGVTDNNQTTYGGPGGSEKWRRKLAYTNRSSGVVYSLYSGDGGNQMWTSSDGSSVPGSFPSSTYSIIMDVWAGSGGYKSYSDLGLGGGTGFFEGASGSGTDVAGLSGGDPATATSPGNATGGDSGTSVPSSGSTNDYKEMFDFLQGIQKNTKSIADSQVKLDTDLQAIKNNQAVGAGAAGGTPSTVDMSGTIAAVDAVKTSVDALKTDMDTEASTSGLPDGDTSAMNDNSEFSQENMDTAYSDEKDSLSTYLDSVLYQTNPIVTVATGSGVNDGGGSSSVSVSAGQFGFSLNFAGCESQLDVIGTFFVAFCGLAGFIEFIRG